MIRVELRTEEEGKMIISEVDRRLILQKNRTGSEALFMLCTSRL